MQLTVILPTHNPDPRRLARTLEGLRAQSLPAAAWELILVDNASTPPVAANLPVAAAPAALRVVVEPELGLSAARRRGLAEARGAFAVLVDDDNVLAPDYLANVLRLFAAHPTVGALGGRVLPEFETTPAAWLREFDDLLACRDLGSQPIVSTGLRNPATGRDEYPVFAPVGAGMSLRRAAWLPWLATPAQARFSDRRGRELSSSGDNDIVFHALRAGWQAAYFPELLLTHLIPASRVEPDYLARLNHGIQKSWMQILTHHAANPWPPLSPFGAHLRMARAWLRLRPWTSPAARIRWRGVCGHFEGRRR